MQASRDDKSGEKKKKESIVDLGKYLDKPIRVKFQGGREGKCYGRNCKLTINVNCTATGVLKGYDTLLNIVIDNTTEYLRGNSACLIC